MGLLQQIGSMIGGGDLQRWSSGQGNFDDPNSPDHQNFQNVVAQADPSHVQQVFSQAAQQMNPQEYSNHITPGVGGTNPLGALGAGGLGSIASALLGGLMNNGYNTGSLISRIPGLRTTNPNQTDPQQVAAVAQYTQQNHPDIFGN